MQEGMGLKWLKILFSNQYVGNVLLAILIGVTVMSGVASLLVWRHRHYREIFDSLLKPNGIKLKYDLENGLTYSHPEDKEWEQFINIVNDRLRHKVLKYRVPRLCGKVKKTFREYKKYYDLFNQKTPLILIDKLKKKKLKFIIWDGKDQPSEDFIERKYFLSSLENIIVNGETLKIGKSGDTRYTLTSLSRVHQIAKSTSKEKIEELKGLIETIAQSEEIKKSIAQRDKTKNDVDDIIKKYNKKLAKIIHDIRFSLW